MQPNFKDETEVSGMSWDETQCNRIKWNETGWKTRNKLSRAGWDGNVWHGQPTLTFLPFTPTVFPRVLLRTLRHPIFLLVVLSQVCMSSMAAGMATFLPKFLERQFSITASYANLLIGCLTIPLAIVGIVVGGILVKRLRLGPMHCGSLCLLGALCCLILSTPLFFMGCSSHQIAGISHQPG